MKKYLLAACLTVATNLSFATWSSNALISYVTIETNGSITYSTNAVEVNPNSCPISSRYNIPNDHPSKNLMYGQLMLAMSSDLPVRTRVDRNSCTFSSPSVTKLRMEN